MKKCSRCAEVKKRDCFYPDKRSLSGLHSWCKQCIAERKKERYAETPELKEKAHKRSRKWYGRNREWNKQYNRDYRKKNSEKILFNAARYRATKYGFEFNISIGDICIPDKCPILEVTLERGNIKSKDKSPSLDRIDNSKGYIRGNICVISNMANQMKSRASKEQIKLFIKNISRYLNAKG